MRKRPLLLLAGLLLALGAMGFWIYRSRTIAPPAIIETTLTPEAMHAAWKTRVAEILQTYDRDQNAQAAEDALLALRVAASDRDVHLELVSAFASVAQGSKNATEKLKRARASFDK